jgi:hypothetical protein
VSELSAIGKIKRAMKLAKQAEVGMTLSYFDVIELLGEIEGLEETIRILDTRDDDALVTAYRKDNAELQRKLEVARLAWISIANGRLPEKFQECIVLDKNKRVHNWIHDDALLPLFAEYTHWMPLPQPPEVK